jgi:TldD protein
LRNGIVEGVNSNISEGVGIRILLDGALVFTSTNILTEKGLTEAVDRAIKMAKASKKLFINSINFSEYESFEVEYIVAEQNKWYNRDLSDKISFLKGIDKNLVNGEYKVKFPARVFSLNWLLEEKIIYNSEGTFIKSQIPRTWLFYLLSGINKGELAQKFNTVGGAGGLENIENLHFEDEVLDTAKSIDYLLNKGISSPTGKMDIVVGNEVAGIIAHESVGHPFEADMILGREAAQAGESYMEPEKIGEQIGSSEVYVSDDPTIPGSGGYYLYDDEGVKARKRELIVEGVINEFLHNKETASHLGVESNGAARALSYDREPIVRMANTFFEPGDYTLDELIEDIEHGIYIKTFMEWNIDDTRLNQRYTGLEAYLIEKGSIKRPVKNPVIEISTYDFLAKLDARGRDLKFYWGTCGKGDPTQPMPVWLGGPHLRFRNINIRRR